MPDRVNEFKNCWLILGNYVILKTLIGAKKGDLQLSFPTFLRLYLYLICLKQ